MELAVFDKNGNENVFGKNENCGQSKLRWHSNVGQLCTRPLAIYNLYTLSLEERRNDRFRTFFSCRCTTGRVCVSPGLFYDGQCQVWDFKQNLQQIKVLTDFSLNCKSQVETMGVVWVQPKIIEWVKNFLGGSCTYYVITFWGPERPPPPCNNIIIWLYPPYVKI